MSEKLNTSLSKLWLINAKLRTGSYSDKICVASATKNDPNIPQSLLPIYPVS